MRSEVFRRLESIGWDLRCRFAAIVNSKFAHYDQVIWLIGDGRSGTTWVSNLINHHGHFRELFEPFHPLYVPEMSFLEAHQYVRPGSENIKLEVVCDQVFNGRLLNRRVEEPSTRINYKGLLVKDIFANLFACWASEKFPHVKTVLLLRNPFAVALSKSKKADWYWVTDPEQSLGQNELVEDYLKDKKDYILHVKKRGDYIEQQILIWAIINSVPLAQFGEDRLHVLAYEELYGSPLQGIEKLYRFLSMSELVDASRCLEIASKPSKVTGKDSTFMSHRSPLDAWQSEISERQFLSGCETLRLFNLDKYVDTENFR